MKKDQADEFEQELLQPLAGALRTTLGDAGQQVHVKTVPLSPVESSWQSAITACGQWMSDDHASVRRKPQCLDCRQQRAASR
jgi:hypothetical protein